MSFGGGVAPSVLDTLEFPGALERVAEHAVCPLGADRIRARIPDTDPDPIRASLAQVAELAARIISDDSIRAERISDIGPALELLAVPGSTLEGLALSQVGVALAAARLVGAELSRLATDAPRVAVLRAPPLPKELETRLQEALDVDGSVRDAASRGLARARQAVRDTRQRLVAKLEALLAGLDDRERAPDAAVTVRGGRYVVPVRSTARGRVGGIIHDESATGATVFLEPPEAVQLGNELRAHEVQEQREVLLVLRELTDRLRPHRDAIAAAWEMCIAFDDLCARARYAIEVNGFAPTIGVGPLAIHSGRHPLLVGGATAVVPFDLTFAPDEFTLLISGPNTGGKTVLIKAVGLICLLAQSGVIPPLGPDSTLPIFREMFADIGDRQSIAESLSTFSAHVAALRDLLERAGPGTMVLLDEIGSGTDPAEGAALAAAVLRTLTRRRVVTLATTHLGALKRLAAETVGIVNASLQFDAQTLTPTYRLLKGVPGRSYGLAIARRLGVDEAILAEAERTLPEAERALDALLAAVEAQARELEVRDAALNGEVEAVRRERDILETRGTALEAREHEVHARARALESQAREQTRAYLLEARRRVEEALGLARAAVDEATAKEARRLVESALAETDTETGTEKRDGGRGKGEGWLSLEDLRRLRQAEASPSTARLSDRQTARVPARSVDAVDGIAPTEISLRGMHIEEAEATLIRALDDAVLAELPYLRVIHGKGTGAVRRLVHEIAARDSRVERFALAPANQGGMGVTVLEFRR